MAKSSIRKLFSAASTNIRKLDVVDLTLGNPFGDPPQQFYRRLKHLIAKDKKHDYMDNAGYAMVRLAVAESLIKRRLMPKTLAGEDIIMTPGASGAINTVLKSILNPKDEVIVLSPYFPDYPRYIENHNGIPIIVTLTPPTFRLDIPLIEKAINKNTKAIIINSPNNPTGAVYTQSEIKSLHALLNKKNKLLGHPLYLLSDEPYREIIYEKRQMQDYISPAAGYRYSFMIYSFSKSLNIPGERIGYIAIHPSMPDIAMVRELLSQSQRILGFTCAPALMQKTITSLLFMKPDVAEYERKKNIMCSGLINNAYSFTEPKGTFYIFVQYPCQPELFLKLSQKHGLYTVPGQAFGSPEFFRIAFSRSDETLEKAVTLLGEIMRDIKLSR